jgi:hypothetical protein
VAGFPGEAVFPDLRPERVADDAQQTGGLEDAPAALGQAHGDELAVQALHGRVENARRGRRLRPGPSGRPRARGGVAPAVHGVENESAEAVPELLVERAGREEAPQRLGRPAEMREAFGDEASSLHGEAGLSRGRPVQGFFGPCQRLCRAAEGEEDLRLLDLDGRDRPWVPRSLQDPGGAGQAGPGPLQRARVPGERGLDREDPGLPQRVAGPLLEMGSRGLEGSCRVVPCAGQPAAVRDGQQGLALEVVPHLRRAALSREKAGQGTGDERPLLAPQRVVLGRGGGGRHHRLEHLQGLERRLPLDALDLVLHRERIELRPAGVGQQTPALRSLLRLQLEEQSAAPVRGLLERAMSPEIRGDRGGQIPAGPAVGHVGVRDLCFGSRRPARQPPGQRGRRKMLLHSEPLRW